MASFGTRRSLRIEKQTRLASWKSDIYPPEIWEHIFGYLTGLQLLRARLVCRRWRDIITGCSPLMRRFRIRFRNRKSCWQHGNLPADWKVIDGTFCPQWLLSVTEIIFQYYCIDKLNPWWSWVGQKLTHLTLIGGLINLSLLCSMLQDTPNLRYLELRNVGLRGTAEPNVQLDQLQVLVLVKLRYATGMMNMIEKIFPRIKDLRIREIYQEGFYDKLLPAIRAVSSTLEALEVDDDKVNVLRDLPEMTRLRRVSVHIGPGFDWDGWSKFFRTQLLIEDLVIFTDELSNNKVLRNIGRAVPRLKRLTLHITDVINTDFLQFMPNLERFEVRGFARNGVVFYRRGSSRIRELHLQEVEVVGIWSFFNHSSQLQRLTLNNCTTFLDVAPNAKVLKNLRTFEIYEDANLSRNWVRALVRKCPFLEELKLSCQSNYKDSVVQYALERLKCLRKLSLEHCPVSDAVLEHIVRHGLALEEVRISEGRLSDEVVEQLRATRDIRVCLIKD